MLHAWKAAETNRHKKIIFIIIARGFVISVKILTVEFLPSTGKSLSETLLFAEHGENMLCTKIVSVHNMISPSLKLEFSCIELVI